MRPTHMSYAFKETAYPKSGRFLASNHYTKKPDSFISPTISHKIPRAGNWIIHSFSTN